jgi:hypothetical protein
MVSWYPELQGILRDVMDIRRAFRGPWPTTNRGVNPYVMLAIGLFTLTVWVLSYFIRPSGSDDHPYAMGIMALMLFFIGLDQLARESQFWWPTWLVGTIHVLSSVWMTFVIFYTLYLFYVLFARHMSPGN